MSKPAKYIALDCETGGVVDGVSLLTVYMAAVDEDFNILEGLSINHKAEDGIYHCTAEALSVNKIDLIAHDKIAKTKTENGASVRTFLMKHSDYGKNKLIPLGHNVATDVRWVWEHLLGKKTWDIFCTYRMFDTGNAAILLIAAGLIPDIKASLGTIVEFFNVEKQEAHTAEGDTRMTIGAGRAIVELLKTLKATIQ